MRDLGLGLIMLNVGSWREAGGKLAPSAARGGVGRYTCGDGHVCVGEGARRRGRREQCRRYPWHSHSPLLLQDVRKARYGDTIAAKMKAAREALPALNVKHAVRSDMTIFNGAGAAPEVHALLDKARPEKVGACGWVYLCVVGVSGKRTI